MEKLAIEIITQGTGKQAQNGDTIVVHYSGFLTNGKKFDSSVDRDEPFSFKLGAGMVIPGWEQGFEGMAVGTKAKLTIHPNLAYGPIGAGSIIPPDATLIFEVELLDII
jgi:FKBP-type peptidyl-prolyl cis-trans isomerase